MKTANPPTFDDNVQAADCYMFSFRDGTKVSITNCDRAVRAPAPGSNSQLQGKYGFGSYLFSSRKVARGSMSWVGGVQPSELSLTIGVNSSDVIDIGLDWRVAAVRGLLDWAEIVVWRTYGNPLFAVNSDGTASASFTIPLFIGFVAEANADRGRVQIKAYDHRVILNMPLPRFTYSAQCRWTLYNPGDGVGTPITSGHGCPVRRADFAVPTTVAAGSTATVVQVPPLTGNPGLPGWFTQGYVLGVGGKNPNQRSSIRQYNPAVQSWIQMALADRALAFYPCADAPGSKILQDVSGNNFNGAVHGAVQFGQTTLGPGWNLAAGMPPPYNTAAWFNNQPSGGGNAYVSCPIPAPWRQPNYGGGITIEFVANVLQQGAQNYLNGIYDSGPGQNYTLRFWRGPDRGQGTGGQGDWVAEWAVGMPFSVGNSCPNGVAGHVCIVYRSQQTVDVYINGNLAISTTTGGAGLVGWGGVTNYGGGASGQFTIGRVVNINYSNSDTRSFQGDQEYFGGYIQGFGVYAFPFGPGQALAHANAALLPFSSSSTASLQLVDPLPVTPATGDSIILYPGCDLTYPTCVGKFNVGRWYGGFPGIPDSEQAL